MDSNGFAGSTIKRSVAALAAGLLVAATAHAGGTKYQSNVVNQTLPQTGTVFSQLKPGKVGFKSSIAPGGGGLVTSLSLGGVDCPPFNDGGLAGKCGVSGAAITDHVLALGISYSGLDLDEVAGLKFQIEKGKTTFMKSGKNTVGGGALGATVTLIFGDPLGIGVIKIRKPGSDPDVCDTTPLLAGNDCTDGENWAIAGVVVGTDSTLTCTTFADCSDTALCTSDVCITETCTADADCDQNQNPAAGTGECGDDGNCCDPTLDPGCAAEVP